MATIRQALARARDGRYDMTERSDERQDSVHAVGYCAVAFAELWPEEPAGVPGMPAHWPWHSLEHYASDRSGLLPFAAHFHSDGHATAEEAAACWRRFQLDTQRRTRMDESAQQRCAACGEWTQRRVAVGMHREFALCVVHDTRACAEAAWDAERAAAHAASERGGGL